MKLQIDSNETALCWVPGNPLLLPLRCGEHIRLAIAESRFSDFFQHRTDDFIGNSKIALCKALK